MKLSDLIREAQEMLEKRGDLKVVVFDGWCRDATCLGYVNYANAACVSCDFPEFVKK